MTFNFLGPGLTVNVEAKVKEQIILDSSGMKYYREDAFCNKLRFSLNCPKFSFDDRSLITHSILGRKFREDHVGPTDIFAPLGICQIHSTRKR